jgi:hypothetical protein
MASPVSPTLSETEVSDCYLYLLGRLLVLRQQQLDFQEGFKCSQVPVPAGAQRIDVPVKYMRGLLRVAIVALAVCCAGRAVPVRAQGVEVMPFGGYRFGGDLFERATQRPLDLDGAPALGIVVNVPLSDGLQVEALVARQDAHASIPTTPFNQATPATRQHLTVDHWQGGGLQELSTGRVRPFLTGMLGLTRYAADGDSEVRFTVGAGGGVKLFPVRHVGVRVDGRVYTTFIDADVAFLACAPGTCIGAVAVDVVWQAEFTMGLVFRFR